MRRGVSARGAVSPDEAWERYAQPARWSSWAPQIRSVDCDGDRLRTGLTGTVHALFGVRADFEVLSVDETLRTWSWRATTGPVTMVLHHAVLSDVAGTMTTLEIDGPLLVPILYAPVAEVALRRLVRP